MDLKHATIGERIELYVYVVAGNMCVCYSPDQIPTASTIPATVIDQSSSATTLAWKELEDYPPDIYGNFAVNVPDVWKQQGFVVTHCYGNHCQYKPSQQTIDYSVLMGEAPCKQCGKQNDLTAKKCWWCETLISTVL